MKRQLFLLMAGVVFSAVCWSPCAQAQPDTLTQFSTIDALLAGLYRGEMSMAELKSNGDLGIGTFDALDGEMLVYKGEVYRVSSDGKAARVADEETTPFAAVTTFVPDRTLALEAGTNFAALPAAVEPYLAPNLLHAFLLEGTFKHVRTRSVPRQHKPYRPLIEVVKEQPVFEFNDVKGVMLGFCCPGYVKGINVPGYHLHFLTAAGDQGGHVLDFTVEDVTMQMDTLHAFVLRLPHNDEFARMDLSRDRKHELEKVEK